MPLEIEIKLKVDWHDSVRKKLHTINAKRKGKVRETNIFFDRPDRSLRKHDSGLRVRFSKADSSDEEALLTFKGPAETHGLRPREAFDLHVKPAAQLIPLIQALGFEQVLLFEKDRESWEASDCHIELDLLPIFGRFLEIEGPDEATVKHVQDQLGLSNLPPVKDSYSKMVAEYLGANPARANELRFEA